jgi:predicted RNase H-like HicB family nuclease
MRKYTIILEPDPEAGGYTVTIPALPGCITQGETVEQCIERAQEAIAGYIESHYGASSSYSSSCS